MTIAEDISAVLSEVGTPCTIYKPDGSVITGEHIDETAHVEHTTPAIRAFFIDFTLQATTQATVGDVIEYSNEGVIITALQPEIFEGTPVDYVASGYRTNVIGEFQTYQQGAGYDLNYRRIKTWVSVYSNVRACMMDRLFRSNVVGVGADSIEVELDRLHLYVSDYYNVETGMRWVNSTGDYYKVAQIEPYQFKGINLVFLTEDTRSE